MTLLTMESVPDALSTPPPMRSHLPQRRLPRLHPRVPATPLAPVRPIAWFPVIVSFDSVRLPPLLRIPPPIEATPPVTVTPEIVTLPPSISNTRPRLSPLMIVDDAPAPWIVRFPLMARSPSVSQESV